MAKLSDTLNELFTPFVFDTIRLTPSEFKVAGKIAAGWDNNTVAGFLNIKVSTVERHINQIYSKIEMIYQTKGRNKRVLISLLFRKWERERGLRLKGGDDGQAKR